MYEHIEIFI